MRGLNKAMLIGELCREPETRRTGSGSAVMNLRVATVESWRNRATGDMQERTEWHNVVLFGRLAEIAGDGLSEGAMVYVEGRVQTRKWQDEQGHDRYTTEVIAGDLLILAPGAGYRNRDSAASERVEEPGDDVPF